MSSPTAADGTDPSMEGRQGINSVELAFVVIEAIERAGRPVKLAELSRAMDMPPSKLIRYLVSLTRVGLLARDHDGAYDFGPSMRRLGAEATRRTNEIAVASQHTPGLRDRTGQSVNISVWGDHGPTICRWDFGQYPLPIIPRTGSVLPLLSTSAGRMFLGLLPDPVTAPLVEAELAGSPDEREARRRVDEIRRQVRRQGWSSMVGAVVPDLTTYSTGTTNSDRQLPVVLTVACAAGTVRTEAEEKALLDDLLDTTQAIARELGTDAEPQLASG